MATTLASLPDVLTVEEFAGLMRVDPSTVYRHVRTSGAYAGVAPIGGMGSRVLFSKALVERALGAEVGRG